MIDRWAINQMECHLGHLRILRSLFNHCTAATFYSVSFSKPNPVWFGKATPKNFVQFSKPIPVWFGKQKLILQDADSQPNSDWFGKF